MGEPEDLTQSQKELIKTLVNEALEEKLQELPTRAELAELAKANDVGAIIKVLEHHKLIVPAD